MDYEIFSGYTINLEEEVDEVEKEDVINSFDYESNKPQLFYDENIGLCGVIVDISDSIRHMFLNTTTKDEITNHHEELTNWAIRHALSPVGPTLFFNKMWHNSVEPGSIFN